MLIRCLQGLALGSVAASSALAGQPLPVLVAAEGRPAAGTSGVFDRLSAPEINDLGEIGFRATLSGDNIDGSNDRGVWVRRDGSLRLVAREGDALPGLEGAVITRIGDWEMIDSGLVVSVGYELDDVSGGAILFDRAAGVEMRLISGPGVAPVDGRVVVDAGFSTDVNDVGDVLYTARVLDPDGVSTETVVIVEQTNAKRIVYSLADRLPSPQGTVQALRIRELLLTGDGTSALNIELETGVDGVVEGENNWGVWVDRGTGLAQVLRSGRSLNTAADLNELAAFADDRIGVKAQRDVQIIEPDNGVGSLLARDIILPDTQDPADFFLRGWFETVKDFTFTGVRTGGVNGAATYLVVIRDAEVAELAAFGDDIDDRFGFVTGVFLVPKMNARGTVVAKANGTVFSDQPSLRSAWITSWSGVPGFFTGFAEGDAIVDADDQSSQLRIGSVTALFESIAGFGGASGVSANGFTRSPRRELNDDDQYTTMVSLDDQSDAIITINLERPCLADVNGDGGLDNLDFVAWLNAFNARDSAADQNRDGEANGLDFGAWLGNFNAGCE